MYCFGRYLVACLGRYPYPYPSFLFPFFFHSKLLVFLPGGEGRTIEFMQRQGRKSFKTPLLLDHNDDKGTIKHPFPMNLFLKPWRLSHWFYQVVKFGIVQYVCTFPLLTFAVPSSFLHVFSLLFLSFGR